MPTTSDRVQGCLLGLAAGDALGTTVEFRLKGDFEPITDMQGGGVFKLPKGHWTDDTSMALCMAYSLAEQGKFDARDIMDRFVRWYKHGYLSSTGICFDIGNTVVQALQRYLVTAEPFSGSTHERASGNGSIMRLAPVPIFYLPDTQRALAIAVDSSRLTHGSQDCLESCRLFCQQLLLALNGADKETILQPGAFGSNSSAVTNLAKATYFHKRYQDLTGSGYVIESLESALWCFAHSENFEQAVLSAANLGNDADTTAAICGQLAGAYYGWQGIPAHWRDCIKMSADIMCLALRLHHTRPG